MTPLGSGPGRREHKRRSAHRSSTGVPRLRSKATRPRRSSAAAAARKDRVRPGLGKETDRRKEIIDLAAPILMRSGYKGISMNELARRLQMTKPGLYYHFKDKQELLYAIMRRSMDFVESMALSAAVSTSDNEQRLREFVYQHSLGVAARERKGALTSLIIDDVTALRIEDQRVITQRKRTYFELVRATITQLQREGRLRPGLDPTVASFTILGMAMWLTKWYEPTGRLSADVVAGQIADMALAAVLTPGDRPPLR